MTEIVLQWKYTRGMQVGIAIGNGDKYNITVGVNSRVASRFCIGSVSGDIILQVGFSVMQVCIDV